MSNEKEIRRAIAEAIKEAAKIGAEVGAKTALETVKAEQENVRRTRKDRRLRNTKLLLKQYRTMRLGCMNSVYDAAQAARDTEDINIEALMSHLDEEDFRVESTFRTAGRTYILVRHMDRMLGLYAYICDKAEREDYKRHYRTIMALYITGDAPVTVEAISASEHVDKRTVYKDIDAAVETLSTLLYGVDGLQY